MEIRYYIDPETGFAHIHNHGVSELEVEQAWARLVEDRQGREESRVIIGQTYAGRYLKVIYVPDEDRSGIFVITAYELTGRAMKAFRRRLRRR